MTPHHLDEICRRLGDIDARLGRLEVALRKACEGRPDKEFFTVAEFAKLVDRAPYTVRDWACAGRIRGEKTHGGRGRKAEWRFRLAEFHRYQAEGLLPDDATRTGPPPAAVRQSGLHGGGGGLPFGPGPAAAG
jgi:hypothetical protein